MIGFLLQISGALFSSVTTGLFALVLVGALMFGNYGRDLPDHAALAIYEPASVSRVYSIEGDVIDEFASERRVFTPIEEIPPLVKEAFISAEDKEFYRHRGYNPTGMAKALLEVIQGGRLRGASTITQQVMKNFLLSSDRSAERKIKELILASRIENTLSKDEILELYLNEIFLGQNSYGVTAAALTYFNKPLEDLSLAEAAYLAALPKAPSTYHPTRQRSRAVSRRNFVLREMTENGYVTEAAANAAKSAPLLTVQSGDIPSGRSIRPPRGYFTDEIRRQISREIGEDQFLSGGFVVRATLDQVLQKASEEALRGGLEKYDRTRNVYRGPVGKIDPELLHSEDNWRDALSRLHMARDISGWFPAVVLDLTRNSAEIGISGVTTTDQPHVIPMSDLSWRPLKENGRAGPKAQVPADLLEVGDAIYVKPVEVDGEFSHWSLRQIPEVQGAFMAMDTNTGRVLAMQGGFSYQHSVFNRVTQALRQPGSSFKPFVYAAALDSGYFPSTILIDAPFSIETPEGIWQPENYTEKYYGPVPMRVGIVKSRNLMTVRLAQDVGMETVAEYAERFGVYDQMEPYLANSLGSKETTLYQMVAAYAMFANGGERVEPTLVDRIQDRWGKTTYRQDRRECTGCGQVDLDPGTAPAIVSERQRIIDRITAFQLTSMMLDVVERGTASSTVNLDFPVAGKTGTTNDSRDAWFIGFSPNIVAGCYIGYDQPQPMGRTATGSGMCGPVFKSFMEVAAERYGTPEFSPPVGGVFLKFHRCSGARLPESAEGEHVVEELFREGDEHAADELNKIGGGFGVGEDLLAGDCIENVQTIADALPDEETEMTTASEETDTTRENNASFGSLSSGGLY